MYGSPSAANRSISWPACDAWQAHTRRSVWIYQHVHDAVGDVDVLFLGMECNGAPLSWLCGPLLPEPIARDKDRSRRLAGCDFDRASQVVERFHPRQVYVYAMGLEPWVNHIMGMNQAEESKPIRESNRLVADCLARGIIAERLNGKNEIFAARIDQRGGD